MGEGSPGGKVELRGVEAADLPTFFGQQLDPEANRMAAFTTENPSDRDASVARWGRGIATAALREFLRHGTTRPLFARVAKDNAGSIRVLQKCGFEVSGEDTGYANARSAETEDLVLRLEVAEGPGV